MDTPVICPLEHEAAALGGAIQAMWAYNRINDVDVTLKELCDMWVHLDEDTATLPIDSNVAAYESSYLVYRGHLAQIYGY